MTILKLPLLALAFTPLVFFPYTLFPFIFPKAVFIQLAVTLFWIGFAVLLLAKPSFFAGRSNQSYDRPHASRHTQNYNHPLVFAVAAFILLATISTIFAFNPYRAFWGDVERGEGLVRLLYFFGFFIGALLVFAPKDWKIFFGLTVLSGAVLFAMQIFTPMTGSLIGNTAFLSAFYLFAIFAAAMLLAGRRRRMPNNARNYAELLKQTGLILMILIFAAGIFLAGTRGAILGLAVGIIAILLFFALYRRKSADTDINPRLRRTASGLLILFLVLTAAFVLTRQAPLWQNIPGLSRVAAISFDDPTTMTRLITAKSVIDSVKPQNEGVVRTLFGWGPENFIVSFQKYYDPMFFRYEHTWFDRAHNKLIDVLVMNGLLGLMAYLVLWGLVFYFILKTPKSRNNAKPYAEQRGNEPLEGAALLFFGAAYFTQNLFVFENISLYIPFFAFLGFLASRGTLINTDEKARINADGKKLIFANKLAPAGSITVAVFFTAILVVTLIAFRQSAQMIIKTFGSGDADVILRSLNAWSSPYTFAQAELRSATLMMALEISDLTHPTIREIFAKSLYLAKESANKEATRANLFASVAAGYEVINDLKTAEKYYVRAVELAPRRQDLLSALALNYARLNQNEKAMAVASRMLALDPASPRPKIYYAVISAITESKPPEEVTNLVFEALDGPVRLLTTEQDIVTMRHLFEFYIAKFDRQRDAKRFLRAMEQAKMFEARYDPARAAEIQQEIEAFKQRGWEAIKLEK